MVTPVEKWVEEQAKLTKPDRIYWCNGSDEEAHKLIEIGIKEEKLNGKPVFKKLNDKHWPNAYYHRSHPNDVARTEQLTFVCHPNKEMAGPNNNWMEPKEAKAKMAALFDGCMKGRTMYVMPYMMGHPKSPYAKACVQITDNSYVAVSMRIMTRMGKEALDRIGSSKNFVRGLHSIGDLNPDRRFIMHYPQDSLVESFGSGYGGNALLGKKCFALRIASCLGKKEGWLAEHMLIMGIEDPTGKVTYIAAAFPSACGKTNLALMQSALPGYKVWTVGDDIAWLNVGPDGRLYAINPEAGFFGVAPGTSKKTNPKMVETLQNNKFFPTLFTNTAINRDMNEPWWEGLDGAVPTNVEDWQGNHPWDPSKGKAAHPNSRFTTSMYNCPSLSKEVDNPQGVPISAILFGGKRANLIPLVAEARDWQQGVFIGTRMGSEITAAASSLTVGAVRRDPMAMLPFCGYNMGDYFGHWLEVGKKLKTPPKIYSINWFRKDDDGKFIWPGFGDNIRVMKWIMQRIDGKAGARETAVGILPEAKDFDLSGLTIPKEKIEKLFSVEPSEWAGELQEIEKYLGRFGSHMPAEIWAEYKKLAEKLGQPVSK
ncbi:MAG TPA: phosphoenolpyruvate carboxykinase (GTP) [Candidatus Omnitrophota bacterium]|nr:phosphoenolpyruvate carboxykinase (GTP) [Candidatus Omnitrophota bacterium]HPS37586.1 phosphoenolpyruvate carboxykinase (GTP) [Candidatus Omnitrophota bacterium]